MKLKSLLAVLLGLLLVACGETGSTSSESKTMTERTDPLIGTSWWVEDISGGGVIDRSRATVEFVEPGQVAGSSSCNRYMGGYERDGESLNFGNLAGTKMACPEALMNQERLFFEALAQVVAWRIDPQTELLHLVNEKGDTVIRASRMPEAAGD